MTTETTLMTYEELKRLINLDIERIANKAASLEQLGKLRDFALSPMSDYDAGIRKELLEQNPNIPALQHPFIQDIIHGNVSGSTLKSLFEDEPDGLKSVDKVKALKDALYQPAPYQPNEIYNPATSHNGVASLDRFGKARVAQIAQDALDEDGNLNTNKFVNQMKKVSVSGLTAASPQYVNEALNAMKTAQSSGNRVREVKPHWPGEESAVYPWRAAERRSEKRTLRWGTGASAFLVGLFCPALGLLIGLFWLTTLFGDDGAK